MKRIMLLTLFVTGLGELQAQTEIDLFRFSALRQHPTGRMAGLGGAFGALGADVGGSTINPAGLATFRRSTISLSPGFISQQSTSDYLGNSTGDNRNRMMISNLGFVYAKVPEDRSSKWKQVNYGFSLNRTNNYLNQQRYEGVNRNSSMIDFFVQEANADPLEFFPEDYPFSAALAETAGLIFPSIPGNRASTYLGIVPNGGITQRESIRSTGNTSEYNFSIAGNYDNILHIGGGVSLMSSSFTQTEIYSESDHMDSIFDFREFTYRRDLGVDADGFMFRFGAILQPVPWFRLGLSYESPTRYTVTEDYRAEIEASFTEEPTFGSARSPLFRPFVYRYRTTGRATFSTAVLFEGKGLISFDYDFVPFDNLTVLPLRSDQSAAGWARDLNDQVALVFRSTNNVRVGGEYVMGPIAFRAGYAYWGGPFRRDVITGGGDLVQQDYTGGIGFRFENMSLDFAIVHARWQNYRSPYTVVGLPEDGVLFRNRRTTAIMTLGFRFD
jgi:long-subunit fatty acid transport protein